MYSCIDSLSINMYKKDKVGKIVHKFGVKNFIYYKRIDNMLRCKQIESPTATLGAQIDSFLVNNNVKSVINMSTIIRERPALSVAFLIYDDGGRTESHEPKVSNLFGEAKVTSELKSSNSVTGQDNSEISKDVLPAVVNSKAETITDNARVMSNLAMSVGNGVKPKRRLGLGMGD